MGAGLVFATASVLAILPGALAGRSGRAWVIAARAPAVPARAHSGSDGAGPISQSVVPKAAGLIPGCHAASRGSHYVNPLARARVKPERIDQGVDYAGAGTLAAIGAAKITYVATTGTGWPGSFIEYRLLDGTYAGCYVYYAEGVHPVRGLHVGQAVQPGQRLAEIIQGWPTGIEVGWGSGTSTVTYAARKRQWSARSDADSVASAAGKSFSALVAALGGPAGRVKR